MLLWMIKILRIWTTSEAVLIDSLQYLTELAEKDKRIIHI